MTGKTLYRTTVGEQVGSDKTAVGERAGEHACPIPGTTKHLSGSVEISNLLEDNNKLVSSITAIAKQAETLIKDPKFIAQLSDFAAQMESDPEAITLSTELQGMFANMERFYKSHDITQYPPEQIFENAGLSLEDKYTKAEQILRDAKLLDNEEGGYPNKQLTQEQKDTIAKIHEHFKAKNGGVDKSVFTYSLKEGAELLELARYGFDENGGANQDRSNIVFTKDQANLLAYMGITGAKELRIRFKNFMDKKMYSVINLGFFATTPWVKQIDIPQFGEQSELIVTGIWTFLTMIVLFWKGQNLRKAADKTTSIDDYDFPKEVIGSEVSNAIFYAIVGMYLTTKGLPAFEGDIKVLDPRNRPILFTEHISNIPWRSMTLITLTNFLQSYFKIESIKNIIQKSFRVR